MIKTRIKVTLTNLTYKEIDLSDFSVIPEELFTGRTDIKKVEFPEGVQVIRSNAFEGCTSLEEVIFPLSLKCIESEAFADCTKLSKADIPEDVKVDASAFIGCPLIKR